MAKLKDLAGLAALGMLGYKLSQKGKDDAGKMADSSSYAPSDARTKSSVMAADMSSPTQSASTQSAVDNTNAGVLKALATPRAAPNDQAPSQGVVPPKSSTSAAKPKTKPRVMTGAQNKALAKANQASADSRNVNYGNEGNRVVGEKSTPAMLPGSDPFEIFRGGKLHPRTGRPMKSGGAVKMASGGMASSASKRADGIATKGKTRGRIC